MSKIRDIDKIYSILVDRYDEHTFCLLRENADDLIEFFAGFKNLLNSIPMKEIKYEEDYTSLETIEICRDFIKNVFPDYLEKFDKCLSNGTINMFDTSDEDNRGVESFHPYYSYEKFETGNFHHNINVPLHHTLNDVYMLIHEFIHFTNSHGKKSSSHDRFILTESMSILSEFLLYDYLKGSNIDENENTNPIFKRIDDYIEDSDELIYKLSLLSEIDSSIDEEYNYIKDDEVKTKEIKDLYASLIYSLGTIIAIMKYYDYMNNRIGVKNFVMYNDSLELNNNLESLNYIFLHKPTEEEMEKAINYLKNDLLGINKIKEK